MTKRKSNPKEKPGDHVARVDDTLVRLHGLRQEIRELLALERVEEMTVEEVAGLAREIQSKGPLAVQSLVDLIFDEDSSFRRRIVMVLSEVDDDQVIDKVRQLLLRPSLPEDIRTSLLAVEALRGELPDSPEAEGPLPNIPFDSLLDIAEGFWEGMEMEELSMMWCESFASQPAEARMAMLEALLSSSHPMLLGVARVELGQGDVKILQLLAEKLGRFDHPLARRMLEQLLAHPDLVVRTLAERSLATLDERPPGAEMPPVAMQWKYYRAYMATDDCSGQYSVVYAVRGPDELIRFLVVLLDRWDRGVVDCWGNVRFDEEQFRDLLAGMNQDYGGISHRRCKKGTALTLIHEAMALNERRNHPLPPEFFAWMHLFEEERFQRDRDVPTFGVDCDLCRKPIRTGPDSAPWVIDEIVVCPRCTKRNLRCAVCGGSTKLSQCLVTRDTSRHQNELRCPHCYEILDLSRA